MSIQDKVERILRDLHVIVSRAPAFGEDEEHVVINKKQMQGLLGGVSQVVGEMMEEYELTLQSRNRGELEAEKRRMEIVRNANHQAQDIYAASVIYSEDALGRIQDIIGGAQEAAKEILQDLSRQMEEERRIVRKNQLELITQLEDLKDTSKYMRLIEERNREIARAKETGRKPEASKKSIFLQGAKEEVPSISPQVRVNEEYIQKAGLAPEGLPEDIDKKLIQAAKEEIAEEKPVYEKPVIKVNTDYFKKLQDMAEDEGVSEEARPEKTEKSSGFFLFGRKA